MLLYLGSQVIQVFWTAEIDLALQFENLRYYQTDIGRFPNFFSPIQSSAGPLHNHNWCYGLSNAFCHEIFDVVLSFYSC